MLTFERTFDKIQPFQMCNDTWRNRQKQHRRIGLAEGKIRQISDIAHLPFFAIINLANGREMQIRTPRLKKKEGMTMLEP